jgi:hypothetical protein
MVMLAVEIKVLVLPEFQVCIEAPDSYLGRCRANQTFASNFFSAVHKEEPIRFA